MSRYYKGYPPAKSTFMPKHFVTAPSYPQTTPSYSNPYYHPYAGEVPSGYSSQYPMHPAETTPRSYASPYTTAAFPVSTVSNMPASQPQTWPTNQGYYYNPNGSNPYAIPGSTINPNQFSKSSKHNKNQSIKKGSYDPNMEAYKSIVPHKNIHRLLDHKGTKVKVAKIYRIQKNKPELDKSDSDEDDYYMQAPPMMPYQPMPPYIPEQPIQRPPSSTSTCSHCSTCTNCSCSSCRHDKKKDFDDNCEECRTEREKQLHKQNKAHTRTNKNPK